MKKNESHPMLRMRAQAQDRQRLNAMREALVRLRLLVFRERITTDNIHRLATLLVCFLDLINAGIVPIPDIHTLGKQSGAKVEVDITARASPSAQVASDGKVKDTFVHRPRTSKICLRSNWARRTTGVQILR